MIAIVATLFSQWLPQAKQLIPRLSYRAHEGELRIGDADPESTDPPQRTPVNQATGLVDYNVVTQDTALIQSLPTFASDRSREIVDRLAPLGEPAGPAEAREHWQLAGEN